MSAQPATLSIFWAMKSRHFHQSVHQSLPWHIEPPSQPKQGLFLFPQTTHVGHKNYKADVFSTFPPNQWLQRDEKNELLTAQTKSLISSC